MNNKEHIVDVSQHRPVALYFSYLFFSITSKKKKIVGNGQSTSKVSYYRKINFSN